jgi:hypothetical protein
MKDNFIHGYKRVFPGHSSQLTPAGNQTVTANGITYTIQTTPYAAPVAPSPALPAGVVDSGFLEIVTKSNVTPFTLPELDVLQPGAFGFFNPDTNVLVPGNTPPTDCCSLLLAGAPLYKLDSISPFMQGYRIPVKSKKISPSQVRYFGVYEPCPAVQSLYALGNIPNVTQGQCCFDFVCGNTYQLKIKVWGDPTYGTYWRDLERLILADGGCCPPVNCSNGPCTQDIYVDPNSIYFQFAQQIVADPELRQFIFPIFYDGTNFFYPPQKFYPDVQYQPGWQTWDVNVPTFNQNQNTPFCANNTPPTGGIILQTAYVETRYGNCTFSVLDAYNYATVKMTAAIFSMNPSPCDTGLCFTEVCPGHNVEGTGDKALRDLSFSEAVRGYHDLYCAYDAMDLRMREANQSSQLFNIINRDQLYVKYLLIVDMKEAYEANTGNRITDTYAYIIYALSRITAFENFVLGWLTNCSQCSKLEDTKCGVCTIPSLLNNQLPVDKFYEYAPAPQRTIKIDPAQQ